MIPLMLIVSVPLLVVLAYCAGRSASQHYAYQTGMQHGRYTGYRDGWNDAMNERLEKWEVREHRDETHRADL